LLQALAGVRKGLPKDWLLLLVGRDDGIGGALKNTATELGLADRVSFMGARDDVADILRVSDVGVLCSREEGFSNAILEGMAAGLPMVVTDVGGNAEAVDDGVNGIVVPPRSPADLGRAIAKLLNDPQLRKRMGQAGYKSVRQHFSLDACIDRYEKLYDALGRARVPEELSTPTSAD
jgi:glycosyltransferase involved in cell wall biosynthesis